MKTSKRMPFIGAHVSAAGGVANALGRAAQLGATCMQIFGSSPRQWAVKMPDPGSVAQYHERKKRSAVKAVYLHAPYLVNIASPSASLRSQSVKALAGHLRIAEALAADGLIFHVGSAMGMDPKRALREAVRALQTVLKQSPGRSKLVIENSAGGGQKLSSSPEEIGRMMRAVRSPRIGVCIDTAHAHAAGLIDRFTSDTVREFALRLDRSAGMNAVVALHINDSKSAYNSHRDLHENIGEGHIGLQGFKALAADPRFRDKAWILEVPGFDDQGPDLKNMEILRSCFA